MELVFIFDVPFFPYLQTSLQISFLFQDTIVKYEPRRELEIVSNVGSFCRHRKALHFCKYRIYIALYPDAQSALQHFVWDFARLLI